MPDDAISLEEVIVRITAFLEKGKWGRLLLIVRAGVIVTFETQEMVKAGSPMEEGVVKMEQT